MKIVSVKNLKEGMELAKPIYDKYGRILLQKHMKLSPAIISRLNDGGITYVYIRDKDTEDIAIIPPIPEEQRLEAIQKIRESFDTMKKNDFMKNSYLIDSHANELGDIVNEITNELSKKKEVIHYLSDILVTDDYVYNHSINVSIYTLALAKELKMKAKETELIGLGAILHDLGKLLVPKDILNKKGSLTDEEFGIIKSHTELGFDLLRKSHHIPLLVAHCAYQHHERLDGSGYPRGITEKEIHPFAKIIGVSDVFDAVTSNRVYRDAMLPHEGLEILYAGAGKKFDKKLVELFKRTVALYPNGLTIYLNDQRVGVVVRQNPSAYERPVVRILRENDRNVQPYDLDLSETLEVMIIDSD
ncbi:HD-GYP domain-containing protein [Gracilibacillus sp. YIM 98692]|uniref:HD-GYP domain-containing protein n=1 Tax=Gracilibacillus sp. YIM 98692 TaxID=2663532 RepID=UPI0013D69949|nr:HD-GYP domain-containing protein [Gracilibacillus sp. YIM 98692]